MPRFKAKHIDDLEPGQRVEIAGRQYLRLADHPRMHIDGWVADLETGWSGPWSRLILADEMVTSTAVWRCPDCNACGAAHCAHPDECGGMKLRASCTPSGVHPVENPPV